VPFWPGHGGPALPGLELVSIDNRAAARAIGPMAFAGATGPAILSQPRSRDRISMITKGAEINGVSFPVPFAEPAPAANRPKVPCLLERLIPDSSQVFLDDVGNDAFAAALRPVAD
jgi:hypothetical protein